ncbi:hypothetical protein BD408DRAFT_431503 [Parasitella parasitica]|nr:hypothetical protein BD408DRAFT_431503 [Parasitella parasitica]
MSTSENSNRNQNVTDQRHPDSKRGPYGERILEKRRKIIDQVLQEGYLPAEAAKENRVAVSTPTSPINRRNVVTDLSTSTPFGAGTTVFLNDKFNYCRKFYQG